MKCQQGNIQCDKGDSLENYINAITYYAHNALGFFSFNAWQVLLREIGLN